MSALATVTTHQAERDGDDWYIEPPEAVEALLDAEPFSGSIWDPACGQGTISDVFLARESTAIISSDIANRGGRHGQTFDFLRESPAYKPVDNIVTNPPYKLIDPFIERAMEIVRHKAAFLMRLAALEGMKRHDRIYARFPLARIHVFSNRISMPPGGRGIEAKGGAVAFCWMVFDKSHKGPPTVNWIRAKWNK